MSSDTSKTEQEEDVSPTLISGYAAKVSSHDEKQVATSWRVVFHGVDAVLRPTRTFRRPIHEFISDLPAGKFAVRLFRVSAARLSDKDENTLQQLLNPLAPPSIRTLPGR